MTLIALKKIWKQTVHIKLHAEMLSASNISVSAVFVISVFFSIFAI